MDDECIMATFDITALYTNIPHNEARATVQLKLEMCQLQDPPTYFLLDLLDLVLEKNYFRVREQFYYQIKGVAMGSACAPSIANIFMERLEIECVYNQEFNPYHGNTVLRKRLIDDIFVILKGIDDLDGFVNWLNSIHPSIKFVGSFSKEQINFLDTYVYRDFHNKLAFKTYRKPSDKNALLHYSSCHSRELVRNLPLGQFLRL